MAMRSRERNGQAMVLSACTVVVLTVLGGALLNYAMGAHRVVENRQLHDETFYLAEGGMEDAISQFSKAIANFQISSTTDRYPAVGSLTTTFSTGDVASSVTTEINPW